MPAAFEDRFFWTSDNVRLHYRDYPSAAGAPVLLCLPGLTRNVRDFQSVAARAQPRFRVLVASLRGRGESGYAADPLSYVPLTYVQDLHLLQADAGIDRAVVLGTSLGGLLGLLLGAAGKLEIAGLILNDVGPEIEAGGLARIQDTLGRGDNWPSWLIAARDIARQQAAIYPDWTLEDWLRHAKRLCRVSRDGRIVWDYDPEIAAPFALPHGADAAALDLWPLLLAFEGRPVLSIRGERSDILSKSGQQHMAERCPGLTAVTVPRVGHAPTLDEPVAAEALAAFLARFAGA